MKLTPVQRDVLTKCVNRKGLFAQEIGMPVRQRSTAHALVRKGFAEWASCQYPSLFPAIRITPAGRLVLEERVTALEGK